MAEAGICWLRLELLQVQKFILFVLYDGVPVDLLHKIEDCLYEEREFYAGPQGKRL